MSAVSCVTGRRWGLVHSALLPGNAVISSALALPPVDGRRWFAKSTSIGDAGAIGWSGEASSPDAAEFSFSSSGVGVVLVAFVDSWSASKGVVEVGDFRGCCIGERKLLRLLEAFDSRLETLPPAGFSSSAPGCDGDGCGVLLLGLAVARFVNGQRLMMVWRFAREGSALGSHMAGVCRLQEH